MDDSDKREIQVAGIIALIGIAGILAQLWVTKPGTRMWFGAAAHRVRTWRAIDPHEGAVRQFSREVSRWDHEQAASQDRRPGRERPCGC